MVGSADIMQAIVRLWDDNDLDTAFRNWWEFPFSASSPLHEGNAGPGQHRPSCGVLFRLARRIGRMSGFAPGFHQEVREIPLIFRVFVNLMTEDANGIQRSALEVYSELSEAITGVYGGHPTISPQVPVLENGCAIELQQVNEAAKELKEQLEPFTPSVVVGMAFDLEYVAKLDVPVGLPDV